MKKQLLITLMLATGGSACASALMELSTKVSNTGQRDIWVTWKSATTVGKVLSAPRSALRQDRYARIKPGKNLSMWHTGDQIEVISYKCENGEIKELKNSRKATTRAYSKVDVIADNNGVTISEF